MRNAELTRLPLGKIVPKGWYRRQLTVQKDGLTGHVHELFKDLSDNSAWLGGNGENWERGPYYLDGLLPLAYLLQDEELISRAQKWIESIFNSQTYEGFFGPRQNEDWWPRMVATKTVLSYFEATGDERALSFLTRYYHFMSNKLNESPLFHWAQARWGEELVTISRLYDLTGDNILLDLAKTLASQGLDWNTVFSDFEYKKPSAYYIPPLLFSIKKVLHYAPTFVRTFLGTKPKGNYSRFVKRFNENSFNRFYHLTHGVNLVMALKYPALYGYFIGEKEGKVYSDKGYSVLMENHGLANGLFSGDEHISGTDPSQGVELCSVSEGLFTFGILTELTAERKYADLMELLAFSTLPATISDDFKAHQYLQQTNQTECSVKRRSFYDSYKKANVFGLKPNYPCCLANMHQGFPKLVNNSAFIRKDTLVLVVPLPMEISTEQSVTEIISEYPFKGNVTVKCLKGVQKYEILIPETANFVEYSGERYYGGSLFFSLSEKEEVNLIYDFRLTVRHNPDKSISVYFGNLLMALPIAYKKRIIRDRNGFDDFELLSLDRRSFAPLLKNGSLDVLSVEFSQINEARPFSTPCVELSVRGVEFFPQKTRTDTGFKLGEEQTLTLVPYGMTKLRISQFPEIN